METHREGISASPASPPHALASTPREHGGPDRLFDAVRRGGAPVLVLDVAVPRLALLRSRHGDALARALLGTLEELIRCAPHRGEIAVERAVDRFTVVYAGAELAAARPICQHLLDRTERLLVPTGAEPAWIRLGIGVAHTDLGPMLPLGALARVASHGAEVALRAGGGRWVHTDLYETPGPAAPARASRRSVRGPHQAVAGTPAGSPPAGSLPANGDVAPAAPLAPAEPALELAPAAPPPSTTTHDGDLERTVDVLRRRVAKLSAMLEAARLEIERLAGSKTIDCGVASVYRDVQGLSEEDERYELKRALMASILEQNLRLRRAVQAS